MIALLLFAVIILISILLITVVRDGEAISYFGVVLLALAVPLFFQVFIEIDKAINEQNKKWQHKLVEEGVGEFRIVNIDETAFFLKGQTNKFELK